MMDNKYKVEFKSNIIGSSDIVYVFAKCADDALEKGKHLLNTHKLIPDFLNQYGRFFVVEL